MEAKLRVQRFDPDGDGEAAKSKELVLALLASRVQVRAAGRDWAGAALLALIPFSLFPGFLLAVAGALPLPALLTTQWRIDDPRNARGLLGPIWREPQATTVSLPVSHHASPGATLRTLSASCCTLNAPSSTVYFASVSF